MKLLVLIIFAFAISPTSALIRTVLMDYWQQIEKEIQPTDNQYNLFIFSEYSEDRRIVKNHAKSNETALTVIIHENHWLRLKIVCGNSSEPMLLEMQAAYRHLHLVVDCDSFQAVLYPHRKYVRGALIVLVVLLVALLVWKREVIRTLITDRYRKSSQKFAIFKNEPEDGQDVNLA